MDLSGKEVQGDITSDGKKLGEYFVDVTDDAKVEAGIQAEKNLGGVQIGGSLYLKTDVKPLLEKLAGKLMSKIPGIGKIFGS